MAKKSKPRSPDMPPGLPQLSDAILSALTEKIDKRLQAPEVSKKKRETSKSDNKSKHAKQEPTQKKKDSSTPRGKKRDSNGTVIAKPKDTKAIPSATTNTDLDYLRAEIIALGGTEDDLALVAGLESASEFEDDEPTAATNKPAPRAKKEDGLRDDVTKMLKDMGVAQTRVAAIAAESEEDFISEGYSEVDDDSEVALGENRMDMEDDSLQITKAASKATSKLAITPRADWFAAKLPSIASNDAPTTRISNEVADHLHQHGKELLKAENEAYQTLQKSADSSQKFYATVINSGTLSDKISALTLAVQESPLHNLKALETLLALAGKRSRSQAIDVLRSLKDLFAQGSLLPSDRRLRTFASQPALVTSIAGIKTWSSGEVLPRGLRSQHLMLWAFEDWLKAAYFETLKILETWCSDELEFSKSRALSYVYELLKEKPEQESNLLRLLVNKLGDPTKKIASRASYLLLQLQLAHPLMKATIISAIENELLWRPGQTLHARYYAVVTLNQSVLSVKEEDIATRLLEIYFGLLVTLLKPTEHSKIDAEPTKAKMRNPPIYKAQAGKISLQEDELREKLTSGILTGINRAYPYTTSEREKVTKHMDTLFRITHSSNFNTSIQAMILIQQLTDANQMSSDRFYRTLYESLLDPRLVTSSKQSLYLNLLFKSVKADLNLKRVKAFVKRMLQVVSLHQPSFVIGVFHLVKELETTFPSLRGLVDQAEEHDVEDEHFRDVVDNDRHGNADENASTNHTTGGVFYDSKKRDPEHSNADRSCLWELLPYLEHFHPSVSVGADSVLNHTKLSGKPDLNLYNLIHFLDRFVYRNPKTAASSTLRGSSVMQPTVAGDNSSLHFSSTAGQRLTPVNNESFWKKKTQDIPADEVFFHQHFSSLGKAKATQQKKHATADSDQEAEDEDAIWKAITESRPDLEGGAESDDGLDMEDLESDFEGSDGEMLDEVDQDVISSADLTDDGDSGVDLVGFDDEDEGSEEPVERPAKTNTGRDRKKKLKALPTFASASDYAAMLNDENGEDLGA